MGSILLFFSSLHLQSKDTFLHVLFSSVHQEGSFISGDERLLCVAAQWYGWALIYLLSSPHMGFRVP